MSQARPKLGEILIQQGLVNEGQIEKALAAQVIHAGRIGSNLVELHYIDLNAISVVLSQQLGVPAADTKVFENIDKQTLALISREVCGQHKILPLAVERKTLHLAMLDPLRLELVDRLSFSMGLSIRPYVVPQLRLLYYLEKHYGIPRPKRFLRSPEQQSGSLTGIMNVPEIPGVNAPATTSAASAGALDGRERRTYLSPTVMPGPTGNHPAITAQHHAAVTAHMTQAMAPVEEDDGTVFLDQLAAPQPPPEAFDFEVDMAFETDEKTPSEQRVIPPAKLIEHLAQAESREAIIRNLLQPFLTEASLSILFLVRAELALGLGAWGSQVAPEQVRALVAPAKIPSLLKNALDTKQVQLGQGSDDSLQRMIASYLRAPKPQSVCVAPIVVGNRVVNVLCLHTQSGFPGNVAETVGSVTKAASDAYLRLIQGSKKTS